MDKSSILLVLGLGGLAIGLAFGAIAQRTRFCISGSISDAVALGDTGRLRMWLLSIAVATAGSALLFAFGIVDLRRSIYLSPNFGWAGALVGGAVFGFGMMLTKGCPSRNLVRLGGGNLRGLVVAITVGITAYMTLRGLFALPRVWFETALNVDLARVKIAGQGIPQLLGAFGLSPTAAHYILAAVVAAALLAICFSPRGLRTQLRLVIGGIGIGLLVPAGWIVTGVLARDEFEPVPLASITFVAPVGEALQYLMIFTGATLNFGIAVVGGVVLGSFAAAAATRSLRLEGFTSARELGRYLIGATMMGIGGVFALGCTVGQGLTGISTLSAGSLLATLGIVGGGVVATRFLQRRAIDDPLPAASGGGALCGPERVD
ncbi:MAG: YeeE/YedE family protein [Alphaproteobacteria bacterium]